MKEGRIAYSPEIKLAAVRDRQNGVGVVEVMKKYQIPNRNRLKDWCRAYKLYGKKHFNRERSVSDKNRVSLRSRNGR